MPTWARDRQAGRALSSTLVLAVTFLCDIGVPRWDDHWLRDQFLQLLQEKRRGDDFHGPIMDPECCGCPAPSPTWPLLL